MKTNLSTAIAQYIANMEAENMSAATRDSEEAHMREADPIIPLDSIVQNQVSEESNRPGIVPLPFLKDEEDDHHWSPVSSMSSDRGTEIGDGEDDGADFLDTPLSKGERILTFSDDGPDTTSSPLQSAIESMRYLSPEDQNDKAANQDNYILPEVIIERYRPGENDMMSGAVAPGDDIQDMSTFSEESVICDGRHDIETVLRHMPLKVITRRRLASFKLPFPDPTCLRILPPDYLTTYLGLQRAIEEVSRDMNYSDDLFMMALIKRGGTSGRQVVYPENIIPLLHFGTFQPDEDQADPYDIEYWNELHMQGDIWHEIDADY